MPDIREGDIDEPDRRTIIANGIVIDVIAIKDGRVYVECYAHDGRGRQVVVESAFIDRYTTRHPNMRLRIADLNAPESVSRT